MTFIRLAGCNLNPPCAYPCDTMYSWSTKSGKEMEIPGIIQEVKKYTCDWVCVTGGEPLCQEIEDLVKGLKVGLYHVEIETNSTFPLPKWWKIVDTWVADIKCPSSGIKQKSRIEEWSKIRPGDQLKFVVSSSEDLKFVLDTVKQHAPLAQV